MRINRLQATTAREVSSLLYCSWFHPGRGTKGWSPTESEVKAAYLYANFGKVLQPMAVRIAGALQIRSLSVSLGRIHLEQCSTQRWRVRASMAERLW